MRQYDICRNTNAASRKIAPFVIVLQADLLQDFASVIVAPLMAESTATRINKLNPVIKLQGKTYRVSMAEMASVLRRHLGDAVANARGQHQEFVAAIDLLFTGI